MIYNDSRLFCLIVCKGGKRKRVAKKEEKRKGKKNK